MTEKHPRTTTRVRSGVLIFMIIVIVVFFLYVLLGATIPFLSYKQVDDTYAEQFDAASFYGDAVSVDRAMLIETSSSAWEERIRMIARAQDRIIISSYDFRSDESGLDVLAALLDAADRGVEIKIIIDALAGLSQMEGDESFYALSSHPHVEVKLYNRIDFLKPWKLQVRLHDKYMIVDDYTYMLGGRNINDLFLGEYESIYKNCDREVLIYNTLGEDDGGESSLRVLEAYFFEMWDMDDCTYFHESDSLGEKEAVARQAAFLRERCEQLRASRPELFGEFDYSKATVETKGIWLLSNPMHTGVKQPQVFYSLIELMKTAQDRVLIHTPYIVCNEYMYGELASVAQAVGDVRLVINSVENANNLATAADYIRTKPDILDTGVSVYEYDGGAFHCKSILIDERLCIIGSFNLDMRSAYLDTELMLVIDSEELAGELGRYMLEFEGDSRLAVDAENYEIPDGHTIPAMSWFKRLSLVLLSRIIRPLRFML